jgi:hypothetical protein
MPGREYLNGSKSRKRWYQQLWYVMETLVPVRYVLINEVTRLFDKLWRTLKKVKSEAAFTCFGDMARAFGGPAMASPMLNPRQQHFFYSLQQPHCKMSLTTITTSPTVDDFTPLSEHHEQTPGSFFAGKPVLHLQAPASKLQVSKEELEANEAVKALVATTDDAAVDAEGLVEIQDIDVWVTSRYARIAPSSVL